MCQTNEILCKAVCHNICVLIQEINEIGVNPEILFGSNETLKMAKDTVNNQKPLLVQDALLHN